MNDSTTDLGPRHFLDTKLEVAVVDQNRIADGDVVCQRLVLRWDESRLAEDVPGGHGELFARGDFNRAVAESTTTDLRA